MGKKRNPSLYSVSKPSYWFQTGFISIVSIVMIVIMVWNISGLQTALDEKTKGYVSDVSYQLASDISSRGNAFETSLILLAESISAMTTPDLIDRYLERQEKYLGFDDLVLIDREGSVISRNTEIEDWNDLSGVQMSFAGENSVTYVEGQNLLFTVPVYEGETVEKVLAGVRGRENMQSLIQPVSFNGRGLSCIIDSTGEVVISPTDLKPFLQLDSLFQEGADQQIQDAIAKMQDDLVQKKSGVFHFTAVDGTSLILSYHGIQMNDWCLLTLVPSDLLSGHVERYVFRMFLIVGGIIVIFVLFLAIFLWGHRKSRIALEKIAFSDPLTGGMNNAAFQLEYRNLAKDMKPGSCFLVLLNVKGFKLINENFGIDTGDRILKYIYSVLKNQLGKNEIVARNDGDHFFLCLAESDPQRIQQRINQMIAEINSFDQTKTGAYRLQMLQGACLVDNPKLDAVVYQDRARIASQFCHVTDRCSFYSFDLTEEMKKEQELNTLFDQSLKNRDFHVFLQPKVSLHNKTVSGAEALVRWIHPQRGVIFPSDFIPLFEKNETICKLDLYMFEEVCRILDRWRTEGRKLIPISVNLSRAHFKYPHFLHQFFEIKKRYCIPDRLVEFELTESVVFHEQQIGRVKEAIHQMHQQGFLCSLDDFGFGFSSLVLLKDFDVDTIKLDRQFFGDIQNQKTQDVIASFIELADKLRIQIVAEGIETEEQLEYLSSLNRDIMIQGYIFSKPLSVADFEQWSSQKLV